MNPFWIVLAVTLLFLAALTCFLVYYASKSFEEIKKGYEDSVLFYKERMEQFPTEKSRTSRKIRKIAGIVLDVLLVILALFFLLSLVDRMVNSFSLPYETMVVATGSMSEKNEKNAYLFENDLDDQIQVNDLIGIRTVDSLSEIELYDIVCYVDEEGRQIVHRVVVVEEGYLLTRGDANDVNDPLRVTMGNLVGVYTHFRIPYVGILVFFVQSDYGILAFCGILYVLVFYDQYTRLLSRCSERRKDEVRKAIGETKGYVLVSKSGTLTVKKEDFAFAEETDADDRSYLILDERKESLPESEFSVWKTN